MSAYLTNMIDLFPVSVDEMITEVDRELIMRRVVYDRRVAERRMSRKDADRKIAIMQAIRDFLVKTK